MRHIRVEIFLQEATVDSLFEGGLSGTAEEL